jgi:hypothetical protein
MMSFHFDAAVICYLRDKLEPRTAEATGRLHWEGDMPRVLRLAETSAKGEGQAATKSVPSANNIICQLDVSSQNWNYSRN